MTHLRPCALLLVAVALVALGSAQTKAPAQQPISAAEAKTIVDAVSARDEQLTKAILKAKPYLIRAQYAYMLDGDRTYRHDPLIRCVGVGHDAGEYFETPEHRAELNKPYIASMKRMIELLLAHGANINAPNDTDGKTVLFQAVESDALSSIDMMKFLVQHGARVDQVDFSGVPLLVSFVKFGGGVSASDRHDRMELLLRAATKVDIRERGSFRSALFYAVSGGSVDFVKMLAAAHANVNAEDHTGLTPLFLAMGSGKGTEVDLAMARTLIDLGASVKAKDHQGNTPLHEASSVEMVRLLVKAGASKSARNKSGQTPLDSAIAAGNKEVILELSK